MSFPQSLLIRRASIILPDGELMVGDVLTRDLLAAALSAKHTLRERDRRRRGFAHRQIVEVAPEISPATPTTEIDAQGLTLLPGVIDPQVHFREPGLEHKEDLFTENLGFKPRPSRAAFAVLRFLWGRCMVSY